MMTKKKRENREKENEKRERKSRKAEKNGDKDKTGSNDGGVFDYSRM